MRLGQVALAGALLLAGCFSPDEPAATASVPILDDVLARAFAFACPPGGEERDGLCIKEIAELDTSLQEPFIAADPVRPGVFAIGVNAGVLLSTVGPIPAPTTFLLDIYITEDGGDTWRMSRIPYVPTGIGMIPIDPSYGSGDPALAFDEWGVLHVSGIASPGGPTDGYDTFYTSSPDLGETWSEPVTFGLDNDNDRNWIGLGPNGRVYVPWQNVGTSSQVAWSPDSGATWQVTPPTEDCITVSPSQVVDAAVLVACAELSDDGNDLVGVRVVQLNESTNALDLVSVLEHKGAVWPHLRLLANGTLVLIFEDFEAGTVMIATSPDAGLTWNAPVDARDLMTIDDEWSRASMHWVEADPFNGLHLILSGGAAGATPFTGSSGVVYAAIDLAQGIALTEAVLPTEARTPPASLGTDYGDHYYGIAFQGDEALMVWTQDKVLDITKLVPEGLVTAAGSEAS